MNLRITRSRRDDPDTSKQGARDVEGRAPSQSLRLLQAYLLSTKGYTDEEAAAKAGLLNSCYWKRCGELRQEGYIKPVRLPDGRVLTRTGWAGTQRMICAPTQAGRELLVEKGLA